MIRFGIVGAGGIAHKFARDILFTKNAKLTAVSARTKEKAIAYKDEYHTDYGFSSYEEMAKSTVIDAAYIATPHNFHYELAILFMKNKKHVLVEKPIAVNLKQYKEMIQVAKDNNVLMMEGMWTFFLPANRYLKNLLDKNQFGNLLEAHIEFGDSLIKNHPERKRLIDPFLAGGSVLDMGVYPLSYYNLIKKAKLKNIQAKAVYNNTVDESCSIEIIDENNAKIHIRTSINEKYINNAKLIFEKAEIIVIDFFAAKEFYIDNKKYLFEYQGEGFAHEIESFSNSIISNQMENEIMSYKTSIESMKLLDKVRELINVKYPFE